MMYFCIVLLYPLIGVFIVTIWVIIEPTFFRSRNTDRAGIISFVILWPLIVSVVLFYLIFCWKGSPIGRWLNWVLNG